METWLIVVSGILYVLIGLIGGAYFWGKLNSLGIEDGDGLGGIACTFLWPITFLIYYSVIKERESHKTK